MAAPATCWSSTRIAHRLRGLGPRPVPSRDAEGLPAGDAGWRSTRAEPLRAEVASSGRGRRSRMRQRVRLDAEGTRLEFHCDDRLARGAARACRCASRSPCSRPRATYEMQFGVVERPTHDSTRRDLAPVRGPRAPLRRPLRARLRRRAAVRGRPTARPVRQRDADDAAALAELARPRGRRGPHGLAYAIQAPLRKLAGGRRDRGGRCPSTRRCSSGAAHGGAHRGSPPTTGLARRHRQARRGR